MNQFNNNRFLPADKLNETEDSIYELSLERDIFVSTKAPKNAKEGDVWINPEDETGNLIQKLPSFIPADRGKYLTINDKGEICWASYAQYLTQQEKEEE